MERELYSALDASINRALEGMRVCEDIARFSIRENSLSTRLKSLRHQLGEAARAFPRELLLAARDIARDEQKYTDLETETRRSDLSDVLKANFHRSLEALRTIEELAKLVTGNGAAFQKVRFSLYDLEKDVVLAVERNNRLSHLDGGALYAILDSSFVKDENYSEICRHLIKGGASAVQLRMKGHESSQFLAVAQEISRLCREHNVLFIVNDRPDIALLSGAGGLHLGQDDMPVDQARRMLPPGMIIGKSTHSRDQALEALYEGPDYIALGPIFNTRSKDGSELKGIGTEIITEVKKDSDVPLVGIGGITADNARDVISSGCEACAVISCLYQNNRIEENCRNLVRAMKRA